MILLKSDLHMVEWMAPTGPRGGDLQQAATLATETQAAFKPLEGNVAPSVVTIARDRKDLCIEYMEWNKKYDA